jgi:hypothetical protein
MVQLRTGAFQKNIFFGKLFSNKNIFNKVFASFDGEAGQF